MHQILFSTVCVAVLLVGCSRAQPPQEPVRAVKVQVVGADVFSSNFEFSGEVKAKVESRLGFRVGGKMIRRYVELGQSVKAGQVLAQLDPQDYKLAVDGVRAQAAAALTNRDVLAADYKRYQDLKDQNFISGAELERREAALKAAQAQLTQANAQLAIQSNQANYAALVADVSGVVTSVDAEVGQVVAAGVPILKIAAHGDRDVIFAVSEDKLSAMKTGVAVKVRVWSEAAALNTLNGHVREVAASADPVTRTYLVKVALDAGQEMPALGATASVLMQASTLDPKLPAVLKLPTTALRREGQGSAVWLLDPKTMTIKSQPVEVATADGNDAVIAAGLQPGMLVVSTGVHVLSSGQKVTFFDQKVLQNKAKYKDLAADSVAIESLPSLAEPTSIAASASAMRAASAAK